ncbi:MAG TPA: hypothetical protein PLS55_01085, partial [Thermogutta sp.]|nr:hypothetical protein [Thermogutta sp.]
MHAVDAAVGPEVEEHEFPAQIPPGQRPGGVKPLQVLGQVWDRTTHSKRGLFHAKGLQGGKEYRTAKNHHCTQKTASRNGRPIPTTDCGVVLAEYRSTYQANHRRYPFSAISAVDWD